MVNNVYIKAAAASGVTSVTGTAPVVSSGGATPAISIPAATSLVDGYLSAADWATFNGKQAALVSATNIKTINGNSILGSGDLAISSSNIYNTNGSLTGARTLTLNSNPLTIVGTSSSQFHANGNVGIGTTTDAGYKLDVNGISIIRSSLYVTSDIYCQLFTSQGLVPGIKFDISPYNAFVGTSGSVVLLNVAHTSLGGFAPTSGTATHTMLRLGSLINQTGGANGITRGLYVNPTLTAAADFRAIETSVGGAYINTTSVAASAILQADSTTKGFLPPRMTTTEKNAIGSPASGLVVYDSTLNALNFYNGTAWSSGGGGGASGIHGFLTQSTFGVTAILTNSGTNTATPASNTMYTYPLIMANDYTFNSMQMYCQTALATGNCRILVYSNLNSNPDQKLYESATIDLSTTGTKTITNTMTFTKGTVYWLVLHAGTAGSPLSIRSINGLTQMATGYRSNNNPYATIQQTALVPLGSAPTTFGAYTPSSLNSPLIALFQ
jgi:hypothetical protein